MKKVFFTASIVLLGAGAAFASNEAKNRTKAVVQGYHFDNAQNLCIDAQKRCDTQGDDPCTWSVNPSVQLQTFISPTMCGQFLFEIEEP